MEKDLSNVLLLLQKYAVKPALFEQGEPHFWDDPHISKGMLAAHLDPNHDAASRNPQTIDKTIEHLLSSNVVQVGKRALDLGCGPGLYASRFCRQGIIVTGIDISQRSIDYAKEYAKKNNLEIDYRRLDFFDIDFDNEFDIALQIYGEINTFPDGKRDALLGKVYKALKPSGLLIFDVSTRMQRWKSGLKNRWYVSGGSFWRPGKHLVLEQSFDYPDDNVWLNQYTVVDESGTVTCYRTWFHDFTLPTIELALKKAGFSVLSAWSDLTGTPYDDNSEWIAIVAQKM